MEYIGDMLIRHVTVHRCSFYTGTVIYTSDAAGNILTRNNARSQTVTWSYDALGRPLSLDYPGAARPALFTYGTSGRLSTVQEEAPSVRVVVTNLKWYSK